MTPCSLPCKFDCEYDEKEQAPEDCLYQVIALGYPPQCGKGMRIADIPQVQGPINEALDGQISQVLNYLSDIARVKNIDVNGSAEFTDPREAQ